MFVDLFDAAYALANPLEVMAFGTTSGFVVGVPSDAVRATAQRADRDGLDYHGQSSYQLGEVCVVVFDRDAADDYVATVGAPALADDEHVAWFALCATVDAANELWNQNVVVGSDNVL